MLFDLCNLLKESRLKIILGLFVFILIGSVVVLKVQPEKFNEQGIWFDQIEAEVNLGPKDKVLIADYFLGNGADLAKLPADEEPRIVFVTLADGLGWYRTVYGTGYGYKAAIEAVAKQLLDQERDLAATFKLDFVSRAWRQDTYSGLPTDVIEERSLYGIAFAETDAVAILPEEVVAKTLVNSDGMLQIGNLNELLPEFDPGHELYRFESTSFAWVRPDTDETGKLVDLYRGHQLFGKLDAAELLASAEAAGRYLVSTVKEDGSFIYTYFPKTDMVPDKYNILRHAGTTYSMLELYEISPSPELLAAIERALAYMEKQVVPCPQVAAARCLLEDDEVKIGGHGLAIVAITKYMEVTGDERYLELAQDLARWIVFTQQDDGRFIPHKLEYSDNESSSFVSGYYPGEAILGLTRLYKFDRDQTWLDTAARNADYLIGVRDAGVPIDELNHDHWLLYGLDELYRLREKKIYLEHVLKIVEAITDAQMLEPAYPDWRGGYNRFPRSTPAATRAEGLVAAYRLLVDYNLEEVAKTIIRPAIELGLAFQVQAQFEPITAMYLPDPQRVLGGFKKSLTDYELRIDYTQHNLSAILGYYSLIKDDDQ